MQKPPLGSLNTLHQVPAMRMVNAVLCLLMAAVLWFSCTRTLVDPDLYWNLKVGMDLCQTGKMAVADGFSFLTQNKHWVNHEWLANLIFGFIYLHSGWAALVLFKALITALMLLVVFKATTRFEFNALSKSLLLLVVAFFASPATNCVRPHIFTCLFMAILFAFVRAPEINKKRTLLCLIPLFVLWVNLHGGFLIGLATLLAWAILNSIKIGSVPDKGIASFWWLTFAACCATTFLTPYGWTYLLSVLLAAAAPRLEVSEWQPIALMTPLGMLWLAMFAASLLSLAVSKKPKDTRLILLWLVFAIAPLISIRHLQFFGIVTAILIGEHLASAWHQFRPQLQTEKGRPLAPPDIIFMLISIGLAGWLLVKSVSQLSVLQVPPGEIMPQNAVAWLKRIDAKGNLVVDFDWGSYVVWYLTPSLKVSYDSRVENAYTPEARLANNVFMSGVGPWDTLLQKFPIDIVLVRVTSPAYNLMKLKPQWKLVREDEDSALFFPVDSAQGKKLEELMQKTQIPALPLL